MTGTIVDKTHIAVTIPADVGSNFRFKISIDGNDRLVLNSIPAAGSPLGGMQITGDMSIAGNVSLNNLTVNGTTTTVNSTVTTLDDPVMTLGGDTVPVVNDSKDRGIEFRYHDGTGRLGFFGYDNSDGRFKMFTAATNTGEIFSGTLGDIQAGTFYGSLSGNAASAAAWSTGRTITLTGEVTGVSPAWTGSDNLSLATALSDTTVAPGQYGNATQTASFTVDQRGRLTAAGSVTVTPAWASVTNTPTTRAGYGITDAQPLDSTLTAMAGVTTAADRLIYFTGVDAAAATGLTAFGRDLIDSADAAAARTVLDIASAAVTNIATGTGLTGGPITTTGTISLANVPTVTVGSYGNATQTATFTVDQQGRLTAAGQTTMTPAWTSITATPTTLSGYGITDGVRSVATGTGLTGGPITGSGTVSLADTAVSAGAYGSATHVATFTVDQQGRLTLAGNAAIAPAWESVTDRPTGLRGQVPFFTTNNAPDQVASFVLRVGRFVETPAELAAAQTEVISFAQVFGTWYRFSHSGTTTYPANPTEANSWSYDSATDTVQSTVNSSTVIGFVSNDYHDDYIHQAQLSSTNADDDHIGIVIAFVTEGIPGEPGYREHTLTALRSNNAVLHWRVYYNYGQETVLFANGDATVPFAHTNPGSSGWFSAGVGCPIRIERVGDIIRCTTGEMGTTTLAPATELTINLASDSRLAKFRGPVRYGYVCQSQAAATFSGIQFIGTSQRIYDLANAKVYEWNGSTWAVDAGASLETDIGAGRLIYSPSVQKLWFVRGDQDLVQVNAVGDHIDVIGTGKFGDNVAIGWSGAAAVEDLGMRLLTDIKNPAVTATAVNYLAGYVSYSRTANIASGVTDYGYRYGINASAHINDPNFHGTLQRQAGLWVTSGHFTGSGPGHIAESFGLLVEPQQSGSSTVGSLYGIFVANENARNYLAGKLGVGVEPNALLHRIYLQGSPSEGTGVVEFGAANMAGKVEVQTCNETGWNFATAAMLVGTNSTTGRSVSAGGTINASGADYAEYETKNTTCGIIASGAIVGFDQDGLLTDRWSQARSFGIKSTAPALVGGDVWGTADALGVERPAIPTGEDADMASYETQLATFETALEAARARVDRIAYAGKVPCNVTGASPGDFIGAAEGPLDTIVGVVGDDGPTVVGRVRRILGDGRALVAVMVK